MVLIRIIRMVLALILTIITWPVALCVVLFFVAMTASGNSDLNFGSPASFYRWHKEWMNDFGRGFVNFFRSELSE